MWSAVVGYGFAPARGEEVVMPTQLSAVEVRAHLGEWHRGRSVLYDGLADALEALIRSGILPPDTRLPAERRLADVLHLSRSTVKAAYDQLRERDLIETRHGSGSVIRPEASPLTGPREALVVSSFDPDSIYGGVLRIDDDAIDLRGAYWIGPECVTLERLAQAHADLSHLPTGHGYAPLGVPSLREAIADHLTATGLPSTPDQIIVTTGAQQAISLIADLLLDHGDTVAVEELTFPSAMDYMTSREARLHPVPFGSAGVDVTALDRTVRAIRPRLTYLVTSVHNPTGIVMPGPARFRLAELAANWDTVVVDDRALADTQWQGTPPTPLAALIEEHARADRVLTVGSISKLTWGGLRIGWIRGTPGAVERLGRLKTLSDLGTPVLDQLIAASLLRDPDLLAERRAAIRERHDKMVAALGEFLPDWEFCDPQGGLCLWVTLPGANAHEFARVAARYGVGLAPGSVASPTRAFGDHLRLPYGQPPDVLTEAARRLAAAWEEYREQLGHRDYDPTCVVV